MNKTPKLRFKEFSGDWESKKLGTMGEFFKGSTLSKANLTEEGRPCILYGELYTKYGEVIKKAISKTNLDDSKLVIGQKNDVLIPSSGETAIDIATASCLQQEDVILGGDLNVFRSDKLNGVFASYQLNNSKKLEIAKLAQGASVVHVYNNQLTKLKLSVPSKEEQEKIASFFSLIDDKISLQGEKVEALKDYKRGMMQKIFSRELRFKDDGRDYPEWEEKKLGDIVETITDYVAAGSFESIRNNVTYIDTPSYAQLVRTVDLKHKFNNKNFVYVDENAFNFLYRVNLNKECTILPNIGANIGESYFIKPELLPHKFNVLAPNAILMHSVKNNNRYLYYLLNTREFHKQLDCMVGASGQPKFNKTELKQMKFKVASLHEQNKICTILERLDLKIEKEQEKLDSLNEYKKGLLQQMFV